MKDDLVLCGLIALLGFLAVLIVAGTMSLFYVVIP